MNMETILNSPQFKQALFDVQSEECERLMELRLPEEITFSAKFERKMERLLRAQRRPLYRYTNTGGKKAILALAASLILLVTLVFSVSAIREPVVRFFVEAYEKFSRIFFHQQEEQYPGTLEAYYAPAWLPEGYREDADQRVDIIIQCDRTYVNESKGEIKFKQYTITSPILLVDTEDVQAKPVAVNGNEGFYYSNKEIQYLTWSDEQYGFFVSGSDP